MAQFWLAGQIFLMQLWDNNTIENKGTSRSSNLQCYAERQACCYQAGHIRDDQLYVDCPLPGPTTERQIRTHVLQIFWVM